MFNSILGQEIITNLQFKKDELSHGRRYESPGAMLEQDIFIPDDRLGLFLQNEIPVKFLPPGRYRTEPLKAKIEIRLVSIAVLLDEDPQRLLQKADQLAYEKAFQIADGEIIAIVRPEAPRRLASGRSMPRGEMQSRELVRRCLSMPSMTEEDDFARDFSFI